MPKLRRSTAVDLMRKSAVAMALLCLGACTSMDREALVGQATPQAIPATPALAMQTGTAVPAPIGFLNFCARLPSECGLEDGANVEARRADLIRDYYWSVAMRRSIQGAGLHWNANFDTSTSSYGDPSITLSSQPPRGVVLDDETMGLLRHVNTAINRAIVYRASSNNDAVNLWRLPLEESTSDRPSGDCKDYVLEKRRVLMEQGVPGDALAIALAETFQGEQHAVLLVSTDHGELVLDSLTDRIKPWNKSGLRWIARQAPGRTFTWVDISDTARG
jgi:predicted transglutaminase-like cysteine proteinase